MKSNVSDYLELVTCIYKDACARCSADVSNRDLETIRSRVEHEGLSFLTITLPQFGKDFERSLSLGCIDPTGFRSFRKTGAIPSFLRGMLGQLFDIDTGRLHERNQLARDGASSDRRDSSVVDSVRQVSFTFKKLELECSPSRTNQALSDFVQTERDLQMFLLEVSGPDRDEFHRVSSCVWDNLVVDLHHDTSYPHHGPGATAERISGNQKFAWKFWHERLDPFFPLLDNAYSISAVDSEEVNLVDVLPEERELAARLAVVPKTLKAPRIIAIEPCCMQYAQQGIRSTLYRAIESYRLTAGHINFRDQSINQALALSASSDGRLATIDLSEASDRVPRDLALDMFNANPDLRDAIDACRSTHVTMPDGSKIGPLAKFASMGSALCFPVESMYFYTVCVAALLRAQNLPVTHKNVFDVSRDVYVYGDDILVPSTQADTVFEYLQKYNCKVNISKTFSKGNFRESCGMDAFLGYPVTPVYLRKERPLDRQHADRLVSWTATANLFQKKGYSRTSSFMFDMVERILGPLPEVLPTSGALGRISKEGTYLVSPRTYRDWAHHPVKGKWTQLGKNVRFNRKYQRLEVKAWVPSPVYFTDELEGYAALQKSLSRLHDSPSLVLFDGSNLEEYLRSIVDRDELHLERSARHGAVTLKRRWVAAT